MRSLYKISGVFAIIASIAAGLFFFTIQSIDCSIGTQQCPPEYSASLGELKGSSLFFSRFDTRVQTLIPDPTFILESESKILPHTLKLVFSQKKPNYYLQTETDYYTVYDDGFIKKSEKNNHEPSIFIDYPIETLLSDNSVKPGLHQELSSLTKALEVTHLAPQKTTLTDSQTITLEILSGVTVFLNLEESAHAVTKLSLLLNSTEIAELPEPLNEIDLRYSFPVLRTKNE